MAPLRFLHRAPLFVTPSLIKGVKLAAGHTLFCGPRLSNFIVVNVLGVTELRLLMPELKAIANKRIGIENYVNVCLYLRLRTTVLFGELNKSRFRSQLDGCTYQLNLKSGNCTGFGSRYKHVNKSKDVKFLPFLIQFIFIYPQDSQESDASAYTHRQGKL